jgi:hypothetical protein
MLDPARRVDERTDVYLLGGCLHEALTGAPPHEGKNLYQVLQAAASSGPRRYDATIPAELAAVCNGAMAADPAARFESVAALRAALADFLRHRGSARLAEEARRRLDEARSLPDDDPGRAPLLREAQFACRQALREWAENPEASRALSELLQIEARSRMRHEDFEGAREALRELDALGALPAELAAEIERARADWVALRTRARDADPRIGRPARVALITAIVLVGTAISVLQWEQVTARWLPYGPGLLFLGALPIVLGTGIAIAVGRKRLLENAISRRIAAFEIAAGVMILANRGLGWAFDASAAQVLAVDDLVIALNCVYIGLFVRAQIARWSVPWAAAALATALVPAWAGELFTAAAVCNVVLMRFVRWDRPLEEAMPR